MTSENTGDWHVTRRIHLAKVPGVKSCEDIVAELEEIEGVEKAQVHSRTVKVCYDLTKTDFRELCERVTGLGNALTRRWPWTWLASWQQSSDATGRENAGLPTASCCNRVPRL